MLNYTTYIISTDTPWVTFIHGAGGSSSIWYQQLRTFRANFNVLLVDLRGHGDSQKENLIEKWNQQYTFKAIGDDVIEVLDYLNIKATHFVGISMGTIIIRELTERFPERTLSMIMGGAVMKLNIKARILFKVAYLFQSIIPYLLLYKIFAFIIMPKKAHKVSRNLFINEAKKLYQKEFTRWFGMFSQLTPILSLFRIKDTGIPTLYVMGAEDHMFLPAIKKLVMDHESSTLYIIPHCGHVVNVDQPKLFNTAVISFIQKVNL